MNNAMKLGMALLLLPLATAEASPRCGTGYGSNHGSSHQDVGVDVWVRSDDHDCSTWVEFEADRTGWVAVYAAFSDGSVERVFPVYNGERHKVKRGRVYSVAVETYHNVRIESVQAVGSRKWFDPNEVWVARAPYCDPHRPALVVTTACSVPLTTWHFSVGWGGHTHGLQVVRSWSWAPRVVRSGHSHGHHGHGHDYGHGREHRYDDRDDRRRKGSKVKWKNNEQNERRHYASNNSKSSNSSKNGRKVKESKSRKPAGGDGAANPSRWTSGGNRSQKKVKVTPGKKSSKA